MGGIGGRGDRTVTSGARTPEGGAIVDLPLVGSAELIDLLTAAAAPVQPHELSWEYGARTVFRSEVARWPSVRRRGRTAIVGLGMAAARAHRKYRSGRRHRVPRSGRPDGGPHVRCRPRRRPACPGTDRAGLGCGPTRAYGTGGRPGHARAPNHSAATGNAAAHAPERTMAGTPVTPGPDAQTGASDQPAAIPAPTNGAVGTAGAPAVTSTTSPTVTATTSNTGGSSDGNAGTGNGGTGTNRGGNQGTGSGCWNRYRERGYRSQPGREQGTGSRGAGKAVSGNGGTGTNRGGNQGTGTRAGINRGGNRGTGPGKGTKRKGTGRSGAKGGGAKEVAPTRVGVVAKGPGIGRDGNWARDSSRGADREATAGSRSGNLGSSLPGATAEIGQS